MNDRFLKIVSGVCINFYQTVLLKKLMILFIIFFLLNVITESPYPLLLLQLY